MEVQGSLGRQIQGISQQPPAVRLDGQCTDMVNMVPDVVDGAKSRMGTTFLSQLPDMRLAENSAYHHYIRDEQEEYFFAAYKEDNGNVTIKAFNKDGKTCNLSYQGSTSAYLNSAVSPKDDLQFLTIADVTFVLNRRRTVSVDNTKQTPTVGSQALLFCAFGQYGTDYAVTIDGTRIIYTTPNGDKPEQVKDIRTSSIIGNLFSKLNESTLKDKYEFSRVSPTVIGISRKDGSTNFTVATSDGAKGNDLIAIKNRVSSIDKLPGNAPNGYKVQVSAPGSKPESRYWLEAYADGGSTVQWRETLAPGLKYALDAGTMPHIIERTALDSDGVATFVVKPAPWEDRKVGDDVTNPFPSFIDDAVPQKLGGMFMVQNRLCLTAGEAVIASRTSDFFNFFRNTAVSALDTDPWDIFSDANEVYSLKHSIALDGDVILFADKSQFLLPGDKPLTKATALLRPTTSFEVDTRVQPVATGESVVFATNEGAYSGLREFYTDSYTDTKKAQALTSHVNRLLEGNVTRLTASTNINRIIVMTSASRNTLYCYDWLWQGTERVQAAWHKWVFPAASAIHSVFYSGETLYLITEYKNASGKAEFFMETMDLGDSLKYGLVDRVRMDRRTQVTWKYNANDGTWVSSALPYVVADPKYLDCVLTSGWPEYVGGNFLFSYNAGTRQLTTTFDLGDENSTLNSIVGYYYNVEFEPTPVIIRDSRDRTSYIDVPTVGMIHLNMDKFPDFEVEVTNVKSGKTRVVKATNRKGGARTNVGGYVKPYEGSFKFPLRALSTDAIYRIKVASPHTFQLRDIEWTGSYNPKRRRV